MADYVPTKEGDLVTWLANLKLKLPQYVAALGLSAAQVTQVQAACDALTGAIQKMGQMKSDYLATSAAKQTQMTTSLGALRGEIGQWKTNPGMTPAIAADLQLNAGTPAFDPNAYKPKISAQAIGDHVQLKFSKGPTDGVNFYWRKQGTAAWTFLSRDTNSPYNDHTPLTTPGVAEVREYQAYGMIHDEQVGQPSDIVTATFAG